VKNSYFAAVALLFNLKSLLRIYAVFAYFTLSIFWNGGFCSQFTYEREKTIEN
jgi:hypothetical protein